jgi:regulator of protease activity HflC (stomatin/prohibitin superfamily)
VDVEVLFTFRIEDPARFVYNTTAPDFDAVCLGAAQATIREIVRGVASSTVLDMVGRESPLVAEALSAPLERYGVTVTRVLVVRVDPPAGFLATREARRLAVLRTSEQEEQAGLDRRVQADRDALARQEAQARYERERERAELAAAVRRREIELEAETESLRLEKLQERLAAYPEAARWDWAGERLKVARELAGNSRAIIQLGGTTDVAEALVAGAAVDAPGAPAAPAAGETGAEEAAAPRATAGDETGSRSR